MQVLETVNDARQTYGLRQDNYERYHAFCTKRLQRLRSTTNTKQQQKGKDFVKIEITPDKVTNVKYVPDAFFTSLLFFSVGILTVLLSILLFTAERHWAYGMQIQQEMKLVDEVDGRRKHHHMMRKFKLAAQAAQTFYDVCAQLASAAAAAAAAGSGDREQESLSDSDRMDVDVDGDADTSKQSQRQKKKKQPLQLSSLSLMEAQAYASVMKGYYAFEKHDWSDGLESFLAARTIYEKLAKIATSPHHEALCQAAIDAIDPNIRFCGYNLSKQTKGSRSAADVDALVEMYKSKQSNAGFVDSQMEAMLAETGANQDNRMSSVRFRGQDITIKNTSVGRHVAQVHELIGSTWRLLDNNPTSAVPLFGSIITTCQSAERLAQADIEQDRAASQKIATSKGRAVSQQLEMLQAFLAYCRLVTSMQRNVIFARTAADQERTLFNPVDNLSSASPLVDRNSELVGICDSIAQNLSELRDIPALSGDTSYLNEIQAKQAYYRAYRCQALATVYVAHKKYAEALALYQKAQEYMSTARLEMHRITFPTGTQNDTAPAIPGPAAGSDEITKMEERLRGRTTWVKTKYVLSKQRAQPALALAPPASLPLMFNFDIAEDASRPGALRLVALPPPTFAVPAKPMFLDLAYNEIAMPDFADKLSDGAPRAAEPSKPKPTKPAPPASETAEKHGTGEQEEQKKSKLGGWLGGLWS
ncbi:signal recognition particle subunit srp68 [Sorochytrium milnesiophthora]